METVRVAIGDGGYPVHVGAGLISEFGKHIREATQRERVVVLADVNAAKFHGAKLKRSLRAAGIKVHKWIEIPSGERSKSWSRSHSLLNEVIESGADRWTPILAFGGGVTGDLAGFVASLLFRGVPLVQIPTTVIAQVDSSVGGKTGINFAGAKNIVGSFYQPKVVLADPSLLLTLSERDYRAGLAEVVKIGVTLRPDLFERLEGDVLHFTTCDPETLAPAVLACVEAKAEVVGRDEKDQDVRSILNYGHTIGHAVEALSLGKLRHGEAVAIGMNAAARVGEAVGITPSEVRIRQNTLLSELGLKLTYPGADNRAIARKLKLDKKVRDKRTRFVLTLQIGGASVWPHIPEKYLRGAIRKVTRA